MGANGCVPSFKTFSHLNIFRGRDAFGELVELRGADCYKHRLHVLQRLKRVFLLFWRIFLLQLLPALNVRPAADVTATSGLGRPLSLRHRPQWPGVVAHTLFHTFPPSPILLLTTFIGVVYQNNTHIIDLGCLFFTKEGSHYITFY